MMVVPTAPSKPVAKPTDEQHDGDEEQPVARPACRGRRGGRCGRAVRAPDRRSHPQPRGPACRIEEPAQVVGEAVEAEVGARHGRVVVVERARRGGGSPRSRSVGVGGVEPSEAERPQLVGHGVRAHGDGTPVDGGLDRRVAEALPRRRERDRVAGRVGVGHGPRRRSVEHAAPARPRGAAQRVLVAVLGRTDEPVGGAEGLGQRHGGGHVLALDGAHRVEQQSLVRLARRAPFGSRRDRPRGSSTSKPL